MSLFLFFLSTGGTDYIVATTNLTTAGRLLRNLEEKIERVSLNPF